MVPHPPPWLGMEVLRGRHGKPGSYWKRPVWLVVDLPIFTVCGLSSLLCYIYQSCFFPFFFGGYTLKNNLVHHLGGYIRNKYAAEILYEWFAWSKWWWMVCQTGSKHIFLRTSAFSGRYLIICIPMIETVAAQAAEGSPCQLLDLGWASLAIDGFINGYWSKPCTPVVHIKIAGKWMFIPLKMVLIGIDPYRLIRFSFCDLKLRKQCTQEESWLRVGSIHWVSQNPLGIPAIVLEDFRVEHGGNSKLDPKNE